ncbi:hypothetical protein SAMN04490248_101149 [Salinihabitans flavidus]|uniref:Uncharacterized protein n=1 Tax=Salinihabitans flavidus TaxID=569882 RepID=A0A1H8LHJ6_9RHOB|nr:hypothetical protein SAMN04490248_101149 [Salinihabitans flavidus]
MWKQHNSPEDKTSHSVATSLLLKARRGRLRALSVRQSDPENLFSEMTMPEPADA